MRSLGNARNPHICPFSLSQNNAHFFFKSTDLDHNLISSEGGQDTSAWTISGHSLKAFSGKCPETSQDGQTDGRMDVHAAKRSRLVGGTNGPMYRWKGGISGFGRTDGQPGNILPQAPKDGGVAMDQYKGGNWLIDGTKHCKDNH